MCDQMETYKLKVKIGEHEFDAEGPTDVVQRQFAVFRELIAAMRAGTPTDPPTVTQTPPGTEGPPQNPVRTDLGLDRIMRADRRVVSLTVRAQSIQDEILLLLLGQKRCARTTV